MKKIVLISCVVFILSIICAYGQLDVDANTVSLYHFEDNHRNIDTFGRYHYYTLESVVGDYKKVSEGIFVPFSNISRYGNYSLRKNGIIIDYLPPNLTDGSVELSVYFSRTGGYDTFFGYPTYFFMTKWSDDKIRIYLYNPTQNKKIYTIWSNTTVQPNTWYNILFTFDGNQTTFYINGVLENKTTTNVTLENLTIPILFKGSNFPSFIDEVRISNIARDPNDKQTDYISLPIMNSVMFIALFLIVLSYGWVYINKE